MGVLDISILVIVLISAIISLFRGFVREVMSLIVWVLAVWIAIHYFEQLGLLLEPYIGSVKIRAIASFSTLFIVTLIVGSMVNFLLSQLVRKTGLSGTDRMVGMLFGVVRGAVVVSVLVMLAGITTFPEEPWWKTSKLVNHFSYMALWMQDSLPPEVAGQLVFDH